MDIEEQYDESTRSGRMLIGILAVTAAIGMGFLSWFAYGLLF